MSRKSPGKGMMKMRQQGALERLKAHIAGHEDNEQLKRHKLEIEKLSELVK